ncbi:MAG: hypothetical protein IPN84_04560 [Sphingomonadales bacterium]|nr:hypothetical protein [Sphingomonadales bacterium]
MKTATHYLSFAPYLVLLVVAVIGIAGGQTGILERPAANNAFAAAGVIAIPTGLLIGIASLAFNSCWPIWVRLAVGISFAPVALLSALFCGL